MDVVINMDKRVMLFIQKIISVLNLDQKVDIFETFDNRTYDNGNWSDLVESILEEID